MKNIEKSLTINLNTFKIIVFICFFSFNFNGEAQVNWTNDGDSYFKLENKQFTQDYRFKCNFKSKVGLN